MTGHEDGVRRRSFLEWAGAVGLSSVAPATVAAIAGAEESDDLPVEPADVDRDGDVAITHPAEFEGVRDRVTAAEEHDDPSEKYSRRLRALVEADDSPDEYDLYVRTVGEPSTEETERYGRQYDGWTVTDSERIDLFEFGSVGYSPDVLSTKVSVYGVSAEELPELAGLEFVLTVGLHPDHADDASALDLGDDEPETGHDDRDDAASVAPTELRSGDMLGFEDLDASDVPDESSVKIGLIDRGYRSSPYFWEENTAEPYLDEELAASFDEDWIDRAYAYHGAGVANTLAYALGDGWQDMLVPLHIGNDQYDTLVDGERAAIEQAALWDLEVINLSQGFDGGAHQHCQSAFCDELAGYVAAGNVAVASAGNEEEWATEPATSLFDVGVGGVEGRQCAGGGQWVDPGSSLSAPARYDDDLQCPVCASRFTDERFVPDVYAVSRFDGAEMKYSVSGLTSFAAPQFTAAAALLKHYGIGDVWDVKDAVREHEGTDVCPDDHARAGGLFDVGELLGDLPPTRPESVTVDWVSDTAASLSWEPAHAPGDADLQSYVALYTYCTARCGAKSWSVDGDETAVVLDGLSPDEQYDVDLFAVDDGGSTSDDVELEIDTLAEDDLVADIYAFDTEPAAGERAQFGAVDRTADGNELSSLTWDFDDGRTDDGGYVEHAFDEPGTYWVTLEATNDAGETTTAYVEITVS